MEARRDKLASLPKTIILSEAMGMPNSARDVMREGDIRAEVRVRERGASAALANRLVSP